MSTGKRVVIQNPINPYTWNVQGKANEPITIAALLNRAHKLVGGAEPDWELTEIYDRLEANSPRIAIIGGSWDHPAHVMDLETVARAALAIWSEGGVPVYFAHPVMCDGTAQSTMGMSYSLQSRNAVAAMVANQVEAQIYHGAFVIAGCDKTPLAVVAGLAHVDTVRRRRGEAPVWATFAPAHVLKGGTIPSDTYAELTALADHCEKQGYGDLAYDLRDTMNYILQCSSGTAFQGVLLRAVDLGLLTPAKQKEFERSLSVATCDAAGGICAFNGTGNSSRIAVTALGFAHPATDMLTAPPTTEQVNRQVADLFKMINRPECSVREILRANIRNAVRVHSTQGGSSNLMMHMVAAMKYAGFDFSVHDIDKIRTLLPVPDIFNFSLTEGRDHYQLAMQKCAGLHRGVETIIYELLQNGVPMDVDAMTVTATTWRERLANTQGLSAEGVKENPIILHTPRREYSGIEVLAGNFFEAAEVKIAGMPTYQVETFDDQVNFVLYFESEEDCNKALLDPHILDKVQAARSFPEPQLRAMARYNGPRLKKEIDSTLPYDQLFTQMVKAGVLKIAMVVSGQGPEAFGMPEMFTPMQHVNSNQAMRLLTTIFSDGRYSGVSYGAAIGHVTPEAARGGGILRLKTGDLLHIGLHTRRVDLLDPTAFAQDRVEGSAAMLAGRDALAAERTARIKARQKFVAAANRMVYHTDAANGVVPLWVAEEATEAWQPK